MTEQQSILITGANSHIGKGLIKYFIEKGNVKLLLTSRSVNSDLSKLNSTSIKYIPGLDLLNNDNLATLRVEAKAFFNTPFSLIHSVGNFWHHVAFQETNLDEAKRVMDSHYATLYGVCHNLLPLMKETGGGRIIAFSCNSVNFNFPYMAAFTAAKASVESLIKCIAHEFAQNNIVANALALSSIQTDAVKASKPFGDYEHYISVKDLCVTTDEVLCMKSAIVNGNTINCYTFSETYYHQGYFERIKTK